ncbi:MAG TPA: hypothetical protein VFY71_15415 [Planctomycetota bacterium]|nr:hypothetical protein [Planctomycetota bacterium]
MSNRHIVTVAILAAIGGGCASVERPDCTAEPGSPAIAITRVHNSMRRSEASGPELEVAAWPDGRLVWMPQGPGSTADLLEAHIEPQKVSALLGRLRNEHAFEAGSFRRFWVGVDSDYVVIQLVSGNECVRLQSWHESFEGIPNLATVNGTGFVLQGESREEVMARATPEWLQSLQVWRDVRSTVAGWIPADGEPCAVPVDLQGPW